MTVTARQLPGDDAPCGGSVASLVLCTVPDQAAALAVGTAGLAVARKERFAFRPSALMPVVPPILGVARSL